MIRKNVRVAIIALAAVVASGCSFSNSDSEAQESRSKSKFREESIHEACGGIFGESAGDALAELAQGKRVATHTKNEDSNLKELAKGLTVNNSKSHPEKISRKKICHFEGPLEREFYMSDAVVKYGQGTAPSTTTKSHTYYSAGSSLIDVDTRPILNKVTNIFYHCRVQDGEPMTIRGSLSSEFWAYTDLTVLQQSKKSGMALLSVSRKLSKELGCTNNLDLDTTSPVKPLPGGSGKPKDLNKPLPSLPESGPLVKERD